MNVRHYHVVERDGQTERVVATFSSAFQAGRDMALRERPPRGARTEPSDHMSDSFASAGNRVDDTALRPPVVRPSITYIECSCTDTQVAVKA